MAKDLGIDGGVIVSGSFQGFDQDYLIHALKSLKGLFVATTQLPVETSDENHKIKRIRSTRSKV